MEELFKPLSIAELKEILDSYPDTDKLRRLLISDFMRCADYADATTWNRAVRLCECLAIIGWGSHEPLEACRDRYFNGYPATFFLNAEGKPRFVDAVWAPRGGGLVIDSSLTAFMQSPDDPLHRPTTPRGYGKFIPGNETRLDRQRNWIAKNPIHIVRTLDNCYQQSRAVLDSIDRDLNPMLNSGMRPEKYGSTINIIYINCAMSFHDNYHCKTNYVVADPALKLRNNDFYPALLAMYDAETIEREGLYMRNRYEIGPFRKETGTVNATIVFEKEFSMQPHRDQKRVMASYFVKAVEMIAARRRKDTDYDFGLMIKDFSEILDRWVGL